MEKGTQYLRYDIGSDVIRDFDFLAIFEVR